MIDAPVKVRSTALPTKELDRPNRKSSAADQAVAPLECDDIGESGIRVGIGWIARSRYSQQLIDEAIRSAAAMNPLQHVVH